MNSLASALGFKRGDMPQSQAVSGTLPLYPALATVALPDASDPVTVEEGAIHAQLCTAYTESPYYRPAPPSAASQVPIKRYTDKYKAPMRRSFHPHFALLPDELLTPKWASEKKALTGTAPAAKRPKKAVEESLAVLEKKEETEDGADTAEEIAAGGKDSEDSDEEEKKKAVVEEKEAVSDEDYAEEDNDYATSYFDNGESYGPDDSGDNIDDENVY